MSILRKRRETIMILINKIEFENFRQYKNINIEFPKSDKFNLHVLRAKNGTGKTTLLNGILWCFYGREHYLSNEDKALPIINDSLVEKSSNGEELYVNVRISVNDEGKMLVFERKQLFVVAADPLRGKNNSIPSASKLSITVTENDSSNSNVIEDQIEVESIVKQYFDESIFDYYFFDGENLKSYFKKDKTDKIKDSIFNISQVTLLKTASQHIIGMATEKYRQSSKINSDDSSLLDDQINLKNKIDDLISENEKIEKDMPIWQEKVDDADSVLFGYAPVRNNQEKRTEYQRKLDKLQNEYKQFVDDRNAFIREYLVLLNYYPRFKSLFDLIIKKESDGNLPPNIDKTQVQNMLYNHVKNCPVCNNKIDDTAVNFLNSLLEKLDVSSETSNYLMSVKSSLEKLIERCEEYELEKDEILQTEKYLTDEITRVNKELDKISSFLANYSTDNSTLDVSKIEKDRKYYQGLISSNTQKKAYNEKDINSYKDRLKDVEEQLETIVQKKSNKDILSKQVSILRTLSSNFDTVKDLIMKEIKNDIQKNTWNRFESMIWKTNTFGSVSINDNYEISVTNINGKEMTGSLSATEFMALAYSFTLAIHEASGKNCPLVVDSPLGRVSDDNRSNMANELLKVSMDKQIIMLFTPDEYSEEVRDVYDRNASTMRDIALSSDESQIEKVGV